MKKLSYLFIAVILGGLTIMSSCNKDDDTDGPPTLLFDTGTDYVSGDFIADTNQVLKIGVRAAANAESGNKLTNLHVQRVFNNTPFVVLDTNINTTVFNLDIVTNARLTEGDEKWIFKLTDKGGQSTEKSFIITTEYNPIPIYTYTDKLLGSYDAAEGSSFASATGAVYLMVDAKANSEKVDWMYSYGTDDTVHAAIMAPSDALADHFFGANMNDFATRNATVFGKVTGVNWDDITDGHQIRAYTTNLTKTNVRLLQVGDVIAFITDPNKPEFAGKHGLIKIKSILEGGAGDITFDVKVEE